MRITIANPIYDAVFKFLMEDERIARVILSALLKKDVVELSARRNEYSNTSRAEVSMFRLDFNARVREADGAERLILIELQKTWVETETLRFRQYLGAQYSQKENMTASVSEPAMSYGIPMVAVYLLGHRVGDITAPVIYVSHDARDYDGNIVPGGASDPFVESLVHDSVIVQIPLLRGLAHGRLATVLSVFDQSLADTGDRHLLDINDERYDGDDDMRLIIHRLTAAAADADLRRQMTVEDEYFDAIERRDTELMKSKVRIEQQQKEIEKQSEEIEKQSQEIDRQKAEIDKQKSLMETTIGNLLRAGMTPEDVASLTGLTVDQVRHAAKSPDK